MVSRDQANSKPPESFAEACEQLRKGLRDFAQALRQAAQDVGSIETNGRVIDHKAIPEPKEKLPNG